VNYIEAHLVAFAQGLRQNDISEQMRIIARGLTPDDMHAVAVFYGVPAGVPRAGGLVVR
jgi:cytochrome c553